MESIKISILNKVATVEGAPRLICGNSDYVISFDFDEEWQGIDNKVARFVFIQDGTKKYIDVKIRGNTCTAPMLTNIERVRIGVYAENIATTTGAEVRCKKSILCGSGEEIVINGECIKYTNIVYNDDNTITLTDIDGVEHTIVCEYDGDKLIGATYDGADIGLTYEGDALVGVDGALVDLSNAKVGGAVVYSDMVYEHFGVDKAEYPYLFFYHWNNSNRGDMAVYFTKDFALNESGAIIFNEHLTATQSSIYPPVQENAMSVLCGVIALLSPTALTTATSGWVRSNGKKNYIVNCANVDVGYTESYKNLVVI